MTGSSLSARRRSILGVSRKETLLRNLVIGLIKYNCTSHAALSLSGKETLLSSILISLTKYNYSLTTVSSLFEILGS